MRNKHSQQCETGTVGFMERNLEVWDRAERTAPRRNGDRAFVISRLARHDLFAQLQAR
jgi:hypothetical protein